MFTLKKMAVPFVVGALTVMGLACAANVPAAAPSGDQTSASPTAVFTPIPTTPTTREVRAPIDEVDLVTRESAPPQYSLVVKSGLPSGCARFNDYGVTRDGNRIKIRVTNTMPADPNVMCTMIYGTHESNIPLGSDFKQGAESTIDVNDKVYVLKDGQLKEKGTDENLAPIAEVKPQVTVPVGGSVKLTDDGKLQVKFVEVLEDSRCAVNVTCIWAGRARIKAQVTYNGTVRGDYELVLDGSNARNSVVIEEFNLLLVSLTPYPGTLNGAPKYVAGFTAYRTGGEAASGHKLTVKAGQIAGKPLTIKVVADITGGADNDKELYCTGWEWGFGDGNRMAATPSCIQWTPDLKMNRHFDNEYTYKTAGIYIVRFTYGRLTAETKVEVK